MSLAQDGLLSSTQTRLLHGHMAVCPPCQTQWEAMTFVSQLLRAAPMIGPSAGFVARVQKRLEYRRERRRRTVTLLFLGLGAFVLLVLALPGVLGTLWLAGRTFLPYQIIAYGQGIVGWCSTALRVLGDSAWLLLRFAATHPTVQTSLVMGTIAGATSVLWMRFVFRARAPQRQRRR
jgi:hypothetical protein